MLRYVAPATFECDELVVGATLESFTFAKKNSLPVLTNGKVVYFDHEFIGDKKKQDEEKAKVSRNKRGEGQLGATMRGGIID